MTVGKKGLATKLATAAKAVKITGLPKGAQVQVNSTCRYNGKRGVVDCHNLGEVGVQFGGGGAAVWFAPEELLRVALPKAKG
jgi:hypothetical protein